MKKIILYIALLLLPAMAAAQPSSRNSQISRKDMQRLKFEQFYEYLNSNYIDTLDNAKLVEDAIKEVLAELDPHSSYSSAEEMKAISETFGGSFSGIGVEFDILKDTLTVVNAIQGGPAESIGVQANDKIIAIDGETAIGISRADVPKRLRGPRGTVVELEIVRRGVAETLRFRITRDNIAIHTVDAAYVPEQGVGYIKVNRFAETTMSEFTAAYNKLGDIHSLILDLRGNGGGLMDQAVEMASFFLPARSLIVSSSADQPGRERKTVSQRNGRFTKGHLVVLIDASSASGSEIVAGAIQDWDRGILIGQQSYGKGLIQRQMGLLDGSAVRITSARYHTPSGRVIQRPYTKGNAEEYYIDHYRRAYDKAYADSVNTDLPQYQTLRSGRTVYGGGGIAPDIIIPLDTTKNYSYWNQLTRAGVINEYINTYLGANRASLTSQYPDFEAFDKGYAITPAMIGDIMALGEERGVEREEQKLDKTEFTTYLKALVAQKLWDTNEYYRVMNKENDPAFAKAIEVLEDWENYNQILE